MSGTGQPLLFVLLDDGEIPAALPAVLQEIARVCRRHWFEAQELVNLRQGPLVFAAKILMRQEQAGVAHPQDLVRFENFLRLGEQPREILRGCRPIRRVAAYVADDTIPAIDERARDCASRL